MQSWLSWFLRGVLVFAFLILLGRLIELQVIKANYYRTLAEENRIRRIVLPAPRGKILARGGEVLVGNKAVKKKIVFKNDGGVEFTDNTTGIFPDETIVFYLRNYLFGSKLAPVSGHLGEISAEEVNKINPKCPEKGAFGLGDWVGRGGLEEKYDCFLRGAPGEELVEVDIHGRMVRILGRREPVPGEDLKTNLDVGLQEKVATFLGETKGAVIATDSLGQVLALYSGPAFDPENIVSALKNPELPLFNRAIGGLFHPGSVFKPVIALAGLTEGRIDRNYVFNDPGVITVNDYSYSNWYFSQYGKTEGTIGVTRALARSTDTFFYKLGESLGIEKIVTWAEKFGFNKPTGIDLPGEVGGLVPTPAWKKKVKNEPWFLGNTYHVSIGQGDLAVTPLAINQMTAAVGAGGKLCTPQIKGNQTTKCKDLGLTKEALDLVKEGMVQTCASGGTGYTFFDFGPIACKTGTAETNVDGKTHAWFTLFYPVDFPEIVLTVLVERGGEGSKVAGPLAREMMDYWLTQHPN